MISVPAMRLHQFGVPLYQAILGARDVDRLVRFEVLSYDAAAHGAPGGRKKMKSAPGVNWELLEKRIAASSEAYQRPIIKKKISELVDYYAQCAETGNLPAIPGAVLLVADRRLEFTPTSSHRVLGVLEIPSEEGVLRALDGQHRLLALHQLITAGQAEDVQVPAVLFDRLTPDQVVELFVTINAKHTKLNPSHLISLSGRRLYPDKQLAAAHDIIRALNEFADSPLHGEIKLFGVGCGRVAQAPLAEELKGIFTSLDALGGRQSDRFRENSQRFFLIYDLNDSPFCLKARICLQLKGVAFRRVTLTVGRMRELRRLNPLGKVPVLVDGGVAIADSSRIARHLEERHLEPALIPVGPEA